MKDVFLLTGSNLGERELYLQQAVTYIEKEIAPVKVASSIYKTQSWGNSSAPDYLNQVLMLQTDIAAPVLLEKVLAIEIEMGRERRERWGPRVIDIDILFYGSEVIEEEGLHVPHPRLHQRRFTLEPLAEIAPGFIHPVLGTTIMQLKTSLNDDLIVEKIIDL